MGELFWNKIAGAVLATLLVIVGFGQLSHLLYHTHAPEDLAYVIEIAEGPVGPAVVEGPTDFGALLRSASLDAGERVARKCVACHTFEKGGGDKTGPHMWGVVGRVAGGVDGFNYSNAMEEYAQEWTYKNLYDYLENPRGYVPGTAMAFAGLRKQEDRINLISYLYSLDDTPRAFPAPLASEPVAVVTPAAAALNDAPVEAQSAVDAIAEDAGNAVDAALDTAGDAANAVVDGAQAVRDAAAEAVTQDSNE